MRPIRSFKPFFPLLSFQKMPFTTDGRVHHSGIANEKAICEFLNSRSAAIKATICPPDARVEHRGGTDQKADAEVVSAAGNKTISIKHHKTGTFDWLNSTAALSDASKTHLQANLRTICEKFSTSTKTDADIATARRTCDDLFAAHLREMPSEQIRALLSGCYEKNTDYVIITDVAKSELVAFDRLKNLPELRTLEGWTYFMKSSPRAKTSAQIWRRAADGTEVNTRLRVRLVLNNGVTALLGLSTSNKSSSPCIKIQQDNVAGFIASLVEPVRETYVEVFAAPLA